MFNIFGILKLYYMFLMNYVMVIFVIDELVWNINIGMNLSFVNYFVNNWLVW